MSQVDHRDASAVVIDGLEHLDGFLKDVFLNFQQIVFAKLSAEEKATIVKELQEIGAIVAFVGKNCSFFTLSPA